MDSVVDAHNFKTENIFAKILCVLDKSEKKKKDPMLFLIGTKLCMQKHRYMHISVPL